MPRHFLFLQGLPGPSFRMLAQALRTYGHRASRINLNGGDWLDWRIGDAVSYRGRADSWADYLRRYVTENGVTDIILFGELRPRHHSAFALAQDLGLQLFEFEEGYLRPNHVTVQRWVGGQRCDAGAGLDPSSPETPIMASFQRRMRESTLYWLATTLACPWYRHYQSHRIYPAWLEMLYWIRRRLRRTSEKAESRAAVGAIGDSPFFLFPLQLDGDAQIVGRSSFSSMKHALDTVLASFANNAPHGTLLLIKRHPFDPDVADWAAQVRELSGQWGVADRVHYVSRHDLDPLLERCCGILLVNSTVGPLALGRGKPVHPIGQAIYARAGLTDNRTLDAFWADPHPPQPGAFDDFVSDMKAQSQVNGGFHSEAALGQLVASALSVLLADRAK
jgi:capsular polysaccharide export protein